MPTRASRTMAIPLHHWKQRQRRIGWARARLRYPAVVAGFGLLVAVLVGAGYLAWFGQVESAAAPAQAPELLAGVDAAGGSASHRGDGLVGPAPDPQVAGITHERRIDAHSADPARVEVDSNLPPLARGWSDADASPFDIGSVELTAAVLVPEVATHRLEVPYRSQLDGSPWEGANCGPVALGMPLEYAGISVSSEQLRHEAQSAQGIRGDRIGTLMDALVVTAQRHGAQVVGFRDSGGLRRWNTIDVRAEIEQGVPVIVQVHMRRVPGREGWPRASDHYLVMVGLTEDGFLYHDPIDADGPGAYRTMTAAELDRAMNAGDLHYHHAGFGVRLP